LYFSRITEIIELNYSNKGTVVLFKCEWAKPAGIRKVENFGVTQINFNLFSSGNDIYSEPFILASQANQVYYVQDAVDDDWHSVVFPTIRDFYDMEPQSPQNSS
jgi:hypothetical protein